MVLLAFVTSSFIFFAPKSCCAKVLTCPASPELLHFRIVGPKGRGGVY